MITSYIRYVCLLLVTILLSAIPKRYTLFPDNISLMQEKATVPILGMEKQGIERSGQISIRYQLQLIH